MNEFRQILVLARLKSRLSLRSHARNTMATLQTGFFILFSIFFSLILVAMVVGVTWFQRTRLEHAYGLQIMTLANDLLFIYVLWILVPLLGFRTNESYDITKLLHLPVKRGTLFLAAILGSFSDISMIVPVSLLATILVLHSAGLISVVFNFFILLLFLINMIIAGQMVVILLYNILPRIAIHKLLIGIILIGYVLGRAWFAFQNSFDRVIHIFDIEVGEKIYIHLPNGMATNALWASYMNKWPEAFNGIFHLALNTLLIGGITAFLYSHWYASGNVEGSPVSATGKEQKSIADFAAAFWGRILRPLFSPQTLAVLCKDHLHLLRNRNFLLYKNLPGVLGPAIVMVAIWHSTRHYPYIRSDTDLVHTLTIMAFGFSVMIIAGQAEIFAGNMFGLEGRNIILLFSTAMERKHILMGKNLFFLTLFVIDALVFGILSWLLLDDFFLSALATILLLNLFFMITATGNFTSILFPYYFDLERPTVSAHQVVLLGLASALSMTVASLMLTPIILLAAIPFRSGSTWMLLPLVAVSLGYSYIVLRLSVRYASPLLQRMEGYIMSNVSEI